jgi:hypothetical protein
LKENWEAEAEGVSKTSVIPREGVERVEHQSRAVIELDFIWVIPREGVESMII